MFGKKKEYYCELCNKKLEGFLSKTKHNNKIYCWDCYRKVEEAEKAAIPSIQPPSKFNPRAVERKSENEIVFWMEKYKEPVRFHIFFLTEYKAYGEALRMTFLGMDRFSGKPAIVTWDKEEEYYPHRVKVGFLSPEQFNDFLSQYPYEVRRLFEGYIPEKWQDYQKANKPLSLADMCIILFRENDEGRMDICICSNFTPQFTDKGLYAEYIETSKEEFEKWREKKSFLDMVKRYIQLSEYDGLFHTICNDRNTRNLYAEIKTIINEGGFWNNAKNIDDGIVEDYNCIIMTNRSRFVCTKKLSREDMDSIFNKVKTKYMKSFFNKK